MKRSDVAELLTRAPPRPDPAVRGASDRPIFLLGCPRSGTTLLQLMLHSHPRIALPPESRFLLETYRRRLDFGDLRHPHNRAALARSIVDRPQSKFGDLGLDRERVLVEITNGPPTLGSALAIVLRAFADRFGKPRWGDKRPAYYQDVSALRRLFPRAQFVHIVRDGRDCVASLKRMPWWKQDVAAAIATWTEALDYGRQAARRLPTDTWHELTYERLVTGPESELRRLCAFLGEDYDDAMLYPARAAPDLVPERKRWHLVTHQEVDASRIGTWRSGLEPSELALVEHVAGDRLAAYGYPPDLRTGPPAPTAVARYWKVHAHRRLSHRKRHLRDRVRDVRAGQPVVAQLTIPAVAEISLP